MWRPTLACIRRLLPGPVPNASGPVKVQRLPGEPQLPPFPLQSPMDEPVCPLTCCIDHAHVSKCQIVCIVCGMCWYLDAVNASSMLLYAADSFSIAPTCKARSSNAVFLVQAQYCVYIIVISLP